MAKTTHGGYVKRQPVPLNGIRDLAVIDVWHPTRPNAADTLGISRDVAYRMARAGELPTIRIGPPGKAGRLVVPVAPFLRLIGREADLTPLHDTPAAS